MTIGSDFESVLQAARIGADWAWAVIYRDLSPSVLRYLRARGAAEPEDLLGEVFVSIVRALSTFSGGESEFRGWVFRCARNAAIDSGRRAMRRPLDLRPAGELVDHAVTDSAEDYALERIAGDRVRALLAKLSDQQREVIYLRVLADLSIDEVARALGRTPGSVKSLQSRGFAALRREISKEAVST